MTAPFPYSAHEYLSPSCWHAVHDECTLVCPYCGRECWCPCHDLDDEPVQEGEQT